MFFFKIFYWIPDLRPQLKRHFQITLKIVHLHWGKCFVSDLADIMIKKFVLEGKGTGKNVSKKTKENASVDLLDSKQSGRNKMNVKDLQIRLRARDIYGVRKQIAQPQKTNLFLFSPSLLNVSSSLLFVGIRGSHWLIKTSILICHLLVWRISRYFYFVIKMNIRENVEILAIFLFLQRNIPHDLCFMTWRNLRPFGRMSGLKQCSSIMFRHNNSSLSFIHHMSNFYRRILS